MCSLNYGVFRLSILQRVEKSLSPQKFHLLTVSTPFLPSSLLPQQFCLFLLIRSCFIPEPISEQIQEGDLQIHKQLGQVSSHLRLSEGCLCAPHFLGFHQVLQRKQWLSVSAKLGLFETQLNNQLLGEYIWISLAAFHMPEDIKATLPTSRAVSPSYHSTGFSEGVLSLPAPSGFLQTSHKVSGKKSNCSLYYLICWKGKYR